MDEISWYVGARITRDVLGNIHWFVESSDGLSHGNLVDEGSPIDMLHATWQVCEAIGGEFHRLYTGRVEQLKFI